MNEITDHTSPDPSTFNNNASSLCNCKGNPHNRSYLFPHTDGTCEYCLECKKRLHLSKFINQESRINGWKRIAHKRNKLIKFMHENRRAEFDRNAAKRLELIGKYEHRLAQSSRNATKRLALIGKYEHRLAQSDRSAIEYNEHINTLNREKRYTDKEITRLQSQVMERNTRLHKLTHIITTHERYIASLEAQIESQQPAFELPKVTIHNQTNGAFIFINKKEMAWVCYEWCFIPYQWRLDRAVQRAIHCYNLAIAYSTPT